MKQTERLVDSLPSYCDEGIFFINGVMRAELSIEENAKIRRKVLMISDWGINTVGTFR